MKQMETKKKLHSTKKRRLDLCYKTKQVVSDGYGQTRSHKRKRAIVNDLYDDTEANSSLMNRVKDVQANLDPEFPTFVKFMSRSSVIVGFLLNFPRSFSDRHMPGHDAAIVLVDESEEEYRTKYLVEKNALSSGWRGFSIAHKLVVGDALVFRLIRRCEFKVYIVRASELDEVDGAVALMQLKADVRQCNSENSSNTTGTHHYEGKDSEHLPPQNIQQKVQKNTHIILALGATAITHQSANENNDVALLLEEIITESNNAANAAKAANSFASRHDFATSNEVSKACEQLYENIGSLNAQLNRLDTLALEATNAVESQKERETKSGRFHTEEEKKKLVLQLMKLIEAKVRLGAEIESLNMNTRILELMCKKEADTVPKA